MRIILPLLFIFLPSLAQAERLPIKTFTVADGLAHNEINKIVRDSRGFLWFCTADGLSRFDGYVFTNYGTAQGLPHPYVNDLLETHAGEVWVATNGGLVRFNPRGIPGKGIISANDASTGAQPMFAAVIPDDSDRRASDGQAGKKKIALNLEAEPDSGAVLRALAPVAEDNYR
jgi:ligand-binding sensor domain-containing protein